MQHETCQLYHDHFSALPNVLIIYLLTLMVTLHYQFMQSDNYRLFTDGCHTANCLFCSFEKSRTSDKGPSAMASPLQVNPRLRELQ